MKAFVVLLLIAFALVDGRPGRRSGKRRKDGRRADINGYFEDWKAPSLPTTKPWKRGQGMAMDAQHPGDKMLHVRWCVTCPREMKKCQRMTTEFNYKVRPRMQWSCVLKETKEACMEEIRNGHADIMTAEGDEIYKAGNMYDMIPIMAEKEDHSAIPGYESTFSKYEDADGHQKHYSIALVKKTTPDIASYEDMRQRKSCHSGVDLKAAFKTPMCSLINAGIVPKVGNVYESAGDFFKESCVPGVQHAMYNHNMTNPESLCKLCEGTKDNEDFCKTRSDKEPLYGFNGTMKCLRQGHGDVGFFHTYDVMKNYQALSREFQILCQNKRRDLEWQHVISTNCHLAVEYPQVLMVSDKKPEYWISNCTTALKDASRNFSSPSPVNGFYLFESTPYWTKGHADEHETKWETENWLKHKDLIFKDHSSSLEIIPPVTLQGIPKRQTYKEYLDTDTQHIWKTCEQLEPKPRAFFCVAGDEEMKKCKNMIDKFETVEDVRRNVSWGCVEASSKKECVEMVAKNLADMVDLNATDMFLAGMDYNLAPFMGKNYDGKDPWTESITIGVMLKDSGDHPEDMRGWKMCNAGVHKISGFLHPMGWLLANGTIERSTSLLKSIGHHFGESCVPGMNTIDLVKHPLLSRILDWRSMLQDQDIMWEEFYKTPLWRKWHDKQSGVDNGYEAMHDVIDFNSPKVLKMLQVIASEDPVMHAYHTPTIHEMMAKLKQNFSWSSYDGLEEFYGLPTPKWMLLSWVWDKPEDWTEMEWRMFMMWAEQQWDQKDYWELHTKKWTVQDWDMFKRWMDTEYQDYILEHMPLHQDIFIRLTLLCSRFYWLAEQWKKLQWDSVGIKYYREKMCDACSGQGDEKCAMDAASEHFYDYDGALKCLKQDGHVAFIDWYAYEDAIRKNNFNSNDFVLLCPDGKIVNEIGPEAVEECNFGRVPSDALVTCNMHDGVWRWKVTKALLEAQKELSPQMFEHGIFGEKTESLTPIPFVNQTYQLWLGPMFLRAMEGLMQPPVKTKDCKEKVYPKMEKCVEEDCDEDFPSCDECEEGDTVCMENCWSLEPSVEQKSEMPLKRRGMMPPKMPLKKPTLEMWKKKNLWKPNGMKMRYMMWEKDMESMKPDMMHMGEMSHQGMKNPKRPPVRPNMNHMGPMKPCMRRRMPGAMHKKPMGCMEKKKTMSRHRFIKHHAETGPMMDDTIRSEFYTNVVFTRDGTCNAIVHDLNCFGEQKNIRMMAGRVGKTYISVPMCPRPVIMKKTTAQFTCNTGASFFKTIMLPVQCSYVPCNPGFWLPDWTEDQYWDHDNSYPGDHWGSKEWWNFDTRDDNDNWFSANRNENRVDKQTRRRGEMKWSGHEWRTM